MLLSILLENFNDDLVVVAGILNLDPLVFHDQLKVVDPSQKHGNFILKLIRSRNIRWPEDSFRVGEAIKTFTKVKPRLPVGSRDINKFKTILELENIVEPLAGTSSKRNGGLGFDPTSLPGVEVVKTVGNYKIIKVSDPESLKKLGDGTKWCTRGSYEDCAAESYIDEFGELFVLFVGDVPTVQWTPDFSQVMDRNDEKLTDRKLCQLIGYEEFILSSDNIDTICFYVSSVINGRWPEAEPVVLKDSYSAYRYANEAVGGRWPEAEPIILTDASDACAYARNVIKGRWLESEPIILTDVNTACAYARDVIKGRWSEAEPMILAQAHIVYLYCYARDVIKGRWPEAELRILKSIYADKYRELVNRN